MNVLCRRILGVIIAAYCLGHIEPALALTPPRGNESDTTVSKTVNRVLVDVVVTDALGRPVRGLQQGQFTVFEDGKPQEVRSFTATDPEEFGSSPESRTELDREKQGISGTFCNLSRIPENAPLNLIVWDTTIVSSIVPNTQIDYVAQMLSARLQLIRFLQRKPPHTRYALFLMAGGVKMLQGFTDRADQLVAAMERPETAVVGNWNTIATDVNPFPLTERGSDNSRTQFLSGVRGWYRSMGIRDSEFELGGRLRDVERTLSGFQQLALILSGLPGRKNVFWLTSSLPWGFLQPSEPLFQMAATLTPSRIAVYPIDWRGLTVDPMFDVSTNVAHETNAAAVTEALARLNASFRADEAARHTVLDVLAEQTGGKAFYNTNDLGEAILVASSNNAAYYTLTYSPSKPPSPGQLRHIRVTLRANSNDYHLAYRRAYYTGILPGKSNFQNGKPDEIEIAAQHGAPPSQSLVFYVTPSRICTTFPQETTASLTPQRAPAKPNGVCEYQSYVFRYEVSDRYIGSKGGTGGYASVNVDFVVVAYDGEGVRLDGLRSTVNGPVSDRLAGQLHLDQRFSVPSGAKWLRFVVRDNISGHLGSIEIPTQDIDQH